jgi:ABC-type anion transport system duplicated permease subunit
MKQKDILLIVVIVVISGVFSILITKSIFVTPKTKKQQIYVVQPITVDFPSPASQFFNSKSIDPTQLITVSPNANTNPFSTGSQQ